MVVECKVIGPVSGIAHPGPILGREANFLRKIFQFGVKTQPTVHILHLTHFDKDALKVAKKILYTIPLYTYTFYIWSEYLSVYVTDGGSN